MIGCGRRVAPVSEHTGVIAARLEAPATTSRSSCTRSHASLDPSADQSKVAIVPVVKWVSWRGDPLSSGWIQMFDAPPTPSMNVSELPRAGVFSRISPRFRTAVIESASLAASITALQLLQKEGS